MRLERNLNRPLRVIYTVVGIAMVLYALLAWMTLPGLAVLLMIILGSVLVAEGAYGH